MCSNSFYKVDEASGGFSEGKRNEADNLYGRYAGNMQFPGGTEGKCSLDQGPLWSTGIDHQREEVTVGTLTGDSILGVSTVNSYHDNISPSGEDAKNRAGGTTVVKRDNNVNPENCCLYWNDQCGKAGHHNCSPVSPPPSGSGKQSLTPSRFTRGNETEVSSSGGPDSQGQRRSGLVVLGSKELQCSSNKGSLSRHCDRNRCILSRMGCELSGTEDRDHWSLEEQELHINALELKAVLLAIQTFTKGIEHQHILMRTDNVKAKTYINYVGGTHSPILNSIASAIWKWCLDRHLYLTAEYLPGVENLVADKESRQIKDWCDWMLHP